MRLNRLDLTRYGKFTDDSIVFDRPGNGGPDLHIIYGLNEAGKSTLFSAFLDLLFGIGLQSPYNFLHAYSAMRIGGQLEFAAGSREFVRVKQRNGLLDSQGNPISDAVIQQELGGIERTAYREFAQSRPSLPFIADDILESFDDLRAEETFRVFADMAKVGQIIYLTHHQHLCDTAKRVCPSVQIHHLGSVACKLL